MNEIREIADNYKVAIIEDAAEALGSEYRGEKCGVFGDIGIYSFNGNKIVTTSAGGAVVLQSEELKTKGLHLATQAKKDAVSFQHDEIDTIIE